MKAAITTAFGNSKVHHSKATATNFSPNFKLSDEKGNEFTFRFIENGNTITLQKGRHIPGQKHLSWDDIFSQENTITLEDIEYATQPGYKEAIDAVRY